MIKAKISGSQMKAKLDPYARMRRHIEAPVLDHPDGSVTKEKLSTELLELIFSGGGGSVTPEQIQELVDNYLEENPITENKEVYTAIVEIVESDKFNIIKGSYDELLDAYNKGLLINLNVLQNDGTGPYLIIGCILSEYDRYEFEFNYANDSGVASIHWGRGNTVSMSSIEHIREARLNTKADKEDTYTKTEVENLINSAIGEALEGDY